MQKSEQINELATALARAQAEICGAKKDSENPFYKSKYADLASVWGACREPLTKNGLSLTQFLINEENKVGCETWLIHSSGQWMSAKFVLTPNKTDPQSVGSAITYARRYTLAAVTSVYADDDDGNAATKTDDDDGNAASEKTKQTKPDTTPKPAQKYTGETAQQTRFKEFLKKHDIGEEHWITIHERMLGQPDYKMTGVLKDLGLKLKGVDHNAATI